MRKESQSIHVQKRLLIPQIATRVFCLMLLGVPLTALVSCAAARSGHEIAPWDTTQKPSSASISDRDIIQTFPQGLADLEAQQDLEKSLFLRPSEDPAVLTDGPSYLVAMDRIKNFFKLGRYEAALLETDRLIKVYQTDPKIYEMRGTLLENLGQHELAMKAWNQSFHINPKNLSLKKFIERKQLLINLGAQ
jgi:tetratricopeptide (TPR) repeat protein